MFDLSDAESADSFLQYNQVSIGSTCRNPELKLSQLFDVIHLRGLDSSFTTDGWKQLIDNVTQVLRPGGVLLLVGEGFELYDESKKLVTSTVASSDDDACAIGRLFNTFRNMVQ